ncbi:MAG: sulfur carrier protein ThiS [Candidatus Methylomirabilales bacterium]
MAHVRIRVNGKDQEIPEGMTVEGLLGELQILPHRVAVQVNLDIIKRERYADVVLREGDHVEVLTFMAGGAGGCDAGTSGV